jgi:Tfp pilus assembly protein PilW
MFRHLNRSRFQRLTPQKRVNQLGFTLIELMVAITGGLFVSMVVFALAREGSKFYQQESRVAESTLGNVVAFDRLGHDIARAGFLSTPNLAKDPLFCGNQATIAGFPAGLRFLASIRITADDVAANNAVLKKAARTPQTITLAGAYSSVDRYEAWHVSQSASGYEVRLQTGIGALLRLGFPTLPVDKQNDTLKQLFPKGRALRLLNADTGTFQFSTIESASMNNGEAYIYLAGNPALTIADQQRCGLRGTTLVNVVNIIQYGLRTVKGDTANFATYQPLFTTGAQPYEENRLELVRAELDTAGNIIVETQEVVAEYAVDLQFALTTIVNPTTNPTFTHLGFENPALAQNLAGLTSSAGSNPQYIRSVRARLSLRSREVDRQENIVPGVNVAPGLYRIELEDTTLKTKGFARVRTLQSDIIVPAHMELRW